ncbi:hypothetical protein H5410_031311 [Solanum commersonii]|uniref:Uncharacterized protein n=1 Tax=Solanum commersonii TaxID=4109 RepID=A0A9J5YIS6_SOLCO|nr:hypothetical protein H5410_031311 [Solanum commersonii]
MKYKSGDIDDDGMVINFTYNENDSLGIRLTIDLPIYDDEETNGEAEEVLQDGETQVGEEVLVVVAAEPHPAIHDEVVPVVEYRCPDLNFPPPEEDDEDI